MKTKFMSVVGIVVALCSYCQTLVAQNITINGSFEDTQGSFVADGNDGMVLPAGSPFIPGWQIVTNDIYWLHNTNQFSITTPYGQLCLDLTGSSDSAPYGGVRQWLPTIPGQTYQVSLSVGVNDYYSQYAGPVSVVATAGTVTNYFTNNDSVPGANRWTVFNLNFTAQSNQTTVNLTGTASSGGYLGLDHVSVVANGGTNTLLTNGELENISNTFVNNGAGAMSLPAGSTVIPGWTVTGAELGWLTNINSYGLSTPYGGMFLDLTGYHDSLPYGGISQTIPTVIGQAYTLSFAAGLDTDNGAFAGPMTIAATAGTNTQSFTASAAQTNDWKTFQFNFVAQTFPTPLTIRGNSTAGGQYIGLDNVSIIQTSASTQFAIASINTVMDTNIQIGLTTFPGKAYAFDYTTNLMQAWKTLTNATLTGDGNIDFLTLTNEVQSYPKYYRARQTN